MKKDYLLKLKNQIIYIKQLNLKNSKFNNLISPINRGDFLQWGDFERQNNSTQKKKMFHNEENISQKFIYESKKLQKNYIRILHISTKSFGYKSF